MRPRTYLAIIASVLMMVLSASIGRASNSKDMKQVFQALYNQGDAAFERKDIDGALATNAPDFIMITKDGTEMDLDHVRTALETALSFAKSIKQTTIVRSVKLEGNGATVIEEGRGHYIMMNPKTRHLMSVRTFEVDRTYWIKTEDGWKEKQGRCLSEKSVIGKA